MNRRPSVEPRHMRSLELAALAIDFDLTPAESVELAAHLATCPACARRVAGLRADARSLALPLEVVPSARVDAAVSAAIARRPVRPQRAWLLAAAAALLVLALLGALAMGAYLLRPRDALPDTVVPSPTLPLALTSPAPAGSPAASPSSAPDRSGEAWQVGTLTGSPGMSGVAAGGPGWVGVGGGAWTSSDGRSWTPATVEGVAACPGPARCPGMAEVAAGVGGFVAIGEELTEARHSGMVWQSPDGRDWRIVGSGPMFDLGPCIEGCTTMTDVAGGPNGFVAIGARVVQTRPGKVEGVRVDDLAWFSPDGLTWEPVSADPFVVAGSSVELAGIASGPAGFAIAGSITKTGGAEGSERPMFWTSADGRTWTRISPTGPRPGVVPATVVAASPGYVAVGGCRDGTCAVAWTSPDGTTWTPHPIDPSESPPVPGAGEAAASDGERVIAFSATGTTVWSSDDGVEWQRHDVDAAAIGFDAVAGGEHGFIAMGLDKAETGVFVWLSP